MLKAIEFSGSQPSLLQYAAQDTYRYFSMAWDDRSEHPFVVLPAAASLRATSR